MAKPQVILDDGGNPAFAIIPWEEYRRWGEENADAELSDKEPYGRAMAAGEESFPIEVADRLLVGENAVKVYRSYRGMTQRNLAAAASMPFIFRRSKEAGVPDRPGPWLPLLVPWASAWVP